MRNSHFHTSFITSLGHQPTAPQEQAMRLLELFVQGDFQDEIFLLLGYAGTGKTTLIAALVRLLKDLRRKTILLAPTGRAAKVLASYAGQPALTIHKKIYRQQKVIDGFGEFSLDRNLHRDTIFIVDEASMIANQSLDLSVFGSGRLLDDLITYVYSASGCKLVLCGDTAQLPPVGLDLSEALSQHVLEGYGMAVRQCLLHEVVRQQRSSGILENATSLRTRLAGDDLQRFPDLKEMTPDFLRISGPELLEQIQSSYDQAGQQETMVVCRSNKQAVRYNLGIRSRILWKEEELAAGDQLMVVKNNYYWMKDETEIDFIANGDIAEVTRIHQYKNLYDLRFARVTLRLTDYRDLEFECWIILDTLSSETASLDRESLRAFFFRVMEDYQHIKGKKHRMESIREDPYFNALQVKYAYALTCHKAQGGQWAHVYIDQGFISEDRLDRAYYRWLYTAITRATQKAFLVNFKEAFFEGATIQ